jgi:hypothetical protein
MRPGLLWAERDVDLSALPAAPADLVRDLELGRLLDAMAEGDPVLLDIARRLVVDGLASPAAIRYRQAVAADFIAVPGLARALYDIATAAVDAERRVWGGGHRDKELVLRRSLTVLTAFVAHLRALRTVAETHRGAVASDGVRALFSRIAADLDDAYLATVEEHIRSLGDRRLVATASLGDGNRGAGYILHRAPEGRGAWRDRAGLGALRGMTIEVALRDQNAMNTLAELRAQALAPVTTVVRDAVAHILGFFRLLRTEAGFYLGCVNLHASLLAAGVPQCWPVPLDGAQRTFAAQGIVDPCLALATGGPVVGNDVDADGAGIVVVTGANGGGKSTLLRAVGVAQILLQAGMPVAATSLRASLAASVLTHFTREDDAGAAGGRLDAELTRLRAVVERALPTSLLLLNESVSGTNERDATEIAHGAATGLADAGVTVWFVTHLYEFASRLQREGDRPVLFLRAERGSGGERPYRLEIAPPLATSFGVDVYRRLRGED